MEAGNYKDALSLLEKALKMKNQALKALVEQIEKAVE